MKFELQQSFAERIMADLGWGQVGMPATGWLGAVQWVILCSTEIFPAALGKASPHVCVCKKSRRELACRPDPAQ